MLASSVLRRVFRAVSEELRNNNIAGCVVNVMMKYRPEKILAVTVAVPISKYHDE